MYGMSSRRSAAVSRRSNISMAGSRERLNANGRRGRARAVRAGHDAHCQGQIDPLWPRRKAPPGIDVSDFPAPGVELSMSDAGPVTIYTANGGRGGIFRTAA